jgi:hypothetical protein
VDAECRDLYRHAFTLETSVKALELVALSSSDYAAWVQDVPELLRRLDAPVRPAWVSAATPRRPPPPTSLPRVAATDGGDGGDGGRAVAAPLLNTPSHAQPESPS